MGWDRVERSTVQHNHAQFQGQCDHDRAGGDRRQQAPGEKPHHRQRKATGEERQAHRPATIGSQTALRDETGVSSIMKVLKVSLVPA